MPDEDARADAAMQRQSLLQAVIWWAVMALLIAAGIVAVSFIAALLAAPPS
jgi:type VI protein secretion system component VasF